MDEVQQNLIFLSIIGIGLSILSVIFFSDVFNQYESNILIIALLQMLVWLPPPDFLVFLTLVSPPQFELFAFISLIIGIGIFTISIYIIVNYMRYKNTSKVIKTK